MSTDADTRDDTAITLAVGLSILGFLPLSLLTTGIEPGTPPPAFIASTLLELQDFRPESGEQLTYLFALAWFPVTLYLLSAVNCQGWLVDRVRRPLTWWIMLPIIWVFLPLSIFFAEPGSWNLPVYQVFGLTELVQPTLLHGLVLIVLSAIIYRFKSRMLVDFTCLSLAALLGAMTVFGENDPYSTSVHLQVLLSPVVQVLHGDRILVELSSQYGFFPHLLMPVFQVFELSIPGFTLLMSLLVFCSLSLLFLALRSLTRNLMVLLFGYCSLLAFTCFWPRYMGLTELGIDPYFQYWPIRTLFPALLVLLAGSYCQRPGPLKLYAGHVLFALGWLWNLDSGIPAWGAWVAFHLFRATDVTAAVKTLLVTTGLLLVVVVVFGIVVYSGAESMVSPDMLLNAHNIFALNGYYMLPMNLLHPWNLLVVVYLVAFYVAVVAWQKQQRVGIASVYFCLSILGAGVFSYYAGRSHDLVFPVVSFPGFILLALFMDWLFNDGQSRGPVALSAGALVVVLSLMLSVGLVAKLSVLSDVTLQRLAYLNAPRTERSSEIVQLIKKNTPPGNRITILSDYATYWHVLSGTAATSADNFNAMFYRTDLDYLLDTIQAGDSVFVDTHFSTAGDGALAGSRRLALESLEGYQPVASIPDGSFTLWRR